ncbi:MAG: hypothetical protein HYY45_06220 [Deltaproteobacteria bacterium]|nr:hypothetical protein [Deltaproteobacteria bacterium]
MHDSLELERRGKPSAVVVTEPFVHAAKTMARSAGIPDYPFAVVAHPMISLSDEELRQRVEVAAAQVRRILGLSR